MPPKYVYKICEMHGIGSVYSNWHESSYPHSMTCFKLCEYVRARVYVRVCVCVCVCACVRARVSVCRRLCVFVSVYAWAYVC